MSFLSASETFTDYEYYFCHDKKIRLKTIQEESECLENGYYLSPAAIALSKYLEEIWEFLPHLIVLELGAGCGLIGLVCANLDGQLERVYLTDHDEGIFNFLTENVQRQEEMTCKCKLAKLEWGLDEEESWNILLSNDKTMVKKKIDLIVASNIIFNVEDVRLIFFTVFELLSKGGACYISSSNSLSDQIEEEINTVCGEFGLNREIIRSELDESTNQNVMIQLFFFNLDAMPQADFIEEEEEQIEMTEADVLMLLNSEMDAHIVCQNIFKPFDGKELDWINQNEIDQLYTRGFFIKDNCIEPEIVSQVSEFVLNQLIHENILFFPHAPKVDDPQRDATARGDVICWLEKDQYPANQTYVSEVMKVFNRLQNDLEHIVKLDGLTEIQLAYYEGNGRGYDRHRDAFPDSGKDENFDDINLGAVSVHQRRITAIVYLNNEWKESNGGKLKLFLTEVEGGDILEIEPLPGRMIVFLSGAVDHEVLPAFAPRVAITSWFH